MKVMAGDVIGTTDGRYGEVTAVTEKEIIFTQYEHMDEDGTVVKGGVHAITPLEVASVR